MDHERTLRAILAEDPLRSNLMGLVRSLGLPDCWIGAGFVRNAVWDHLHGWPVRPPSGDVDVVWFDPAQAHQPADRRAEAALHDMEPSIPWSVRNQARMHARNGDAPYASTIDALRGWPETATAVAVRQADAEPCEIAAPFGLGDLFGLVLRPTPRFAAGKHALYLERIRTKRWLTTWPMLRMEAAIAPERN